MDRASQLLIETDLPIGTIASMVGVADRRAFNKMVNQAFGLSPREYRKGRLLRP
jgi:transcriptional regulator GlxA family with amidase domain